MSKVFGIVGGGERNRGEPGVRASVAQMKHSGALVEGATVDVPGLKLATLAYRGQKHTGFASDPAGTAHLYIHGEIYEKGIYHTEDSTAAVRALLEEYLVRGIPALQDLHGLYTAIVYRPAEKTIQFVTDRFVLKKIYWYVDPRDRAFIFSSEIWPLLPYLADRNPDPEGIADLLTLGYLTGTRTLLRGVTILDPGEVTTVRDGEVECSRYWDWTYAHDEVTSISDSADQLHEALRGSVDLATRSGNRMIINLSGGKDSRLLCCHARALGRNFTSLNYGHPGCDDVRFAVRAARALDIPLTQHPFPDDFIWRNLDRSTRLYNGSTPIEQGFHLIETEDKDDAGDVPVLVNGHMGCVISGLHLTNFNHAAGVFLGLPAPRRWPRLDIVDAPMRDDVARHLLTMFCRRFQPTQLPGLVTDPDVLAAAPRVVERQWEPARGRDFDLVQWFMQYVDCTQRQDRWTTSVLELLSNTCIVRCPYASPGVYDVTDRWSTRTMLNQRAYKVMFHRYFPKLASIPTPDGRAATSDTLEIVYALRGAAERKVAAATRRWGLDRRPWAPTYIDYNAQIVSRYDDYRGFLEANRAGLSRWFDEKVVFNYLEGIRSRPDPERRTEQRFFSLLALVLAQRDLFG